MFDLQPLLPESPNDSGLPFRLREKCFRTYEPVIAECLKQWPETLTFNPSPLRATTAAARLRDSMLALYRLHWPTTLIDTDLFNALYAKKAIVVLQSDQSVLIGPRANTRNRQKEGFNVSSFQSAPKSGILFDAGRWTDEDLNAVCQLLSNRLISGPVYISPALTVERCAELESKFDIASTPSGEKTMIV